jgi:FtsP/CotA-like multicopper oxidase with cupredoxin domain
MSLKREAMRETKMKKAISKSSLLPVAMMAIGLLFAATAHAAAPGITGPTFNLTAQTAFLNQPDGEAVYSWGYGCNASFAQPGFLPAMPHQNCPEMQVPGPTLIVTEGATVTVNLLNGLPTAAGNTSILFPGFAVTATGGVQGLLAMEAAPGGSVTYSFVATTPGTHAYYSGTQGDLQIEMGLYGAIVVLPSSAPACSSVSSLYGVPTAAPANAPETDFRLAHAAYDNAKTCYDREYLFQWAEMDANIHHAALAQVTAKVGCVAGAPGCSLEVPTEPYQPSYFLINGRSMPDVMDANFGAEYPHQPYNGNPHMHPGEQVLIRTVGQGRWQHPFHEHGNHVRILARDGNLILGTKPGAVAGTTVADANSLAGLLMFNTDTTPGQAFDGIFYWSGRGLNWDPYGHHSGADAFNDGLATEPCNPDANGYYTTASSPAAPTTAPNYYEWCQDHNKPLEVAPLGDVASGGPATLPNPNIFTNGAWYGGTPYLGTDATLRAFAPNCATTSTATLTCSSQQPSNTQANPANERGFAFMWHSHNEREITTNNVFPGGMLMMMLVDSREFTIDESN